MEMMDWSALLDCYLKDDCSSGDDALRQPKEHKSGARSMFSFNAQIVIRTNNLHCLYDSTVSVVMNSRGNNMLDTCLYQATIQVKDAWLNIVDAPLITMIQLINKMSVTCINDKISTKYP